MDGLYRNPEKAIRQGKGVWVQCETGGLVQILKSGAEKYRAIAVQDTEGKAYNGNLDAPLAFTFARVGPTGKCPKGYRLLEIEEWRPLGGLAGEAKGGA